MSDAAGVALNCTANDLGLASFSVTNVIEACDSVGDTMTIDGTINVNGGSPSRFDIGFYIGRDGLQALTGTDCNVSIRPPSELSLDGDSCGDYNGTAFALAVTNVTVACVDDDSDGFFDLAVCTSYDNNAGGVCTGESTAFPPNGAKCQCDQPLNTNLSVPRCATNAECDDSNTCTTDTCLLTGGDLFGCSYANNANSCDDGEFCNGADTCSGGTCSSHAGDPCTGGGECADTCNETTDTCNDPLDSPCTDDGNVCTDDVCDGAGSCSHPNNTDPCDDGEFCNGADTCSGGTCSSHAGDPCTAGGECADSCNEVADNCFDLNTTACTDDGNGCTNDFCDGTGSCAHPNNTDPCDDGEFCNGDDTCAGGTCSSHAGDPCTGGGECADTCNEGADNCFDPNTTVCTDDGEICTDDFCDGAGACAHPANTDPCDDGEFCNGDDTCSGGTCSSHAGDPCTGGGECAETCNETADNCFDLNTTVCTDDGNVCTNDFCDGVGSCAHPNNTAPCDDGQFCNGTDTCQAGACVSSGDPCTAGGECADSCNEATDNCFDADTTACTDDGNTCTNDFCDGVGSCAHPNNTDPCDDGLFCTSSDVCVAGVCVGSGDPCITGPECANDCNEAADNCFDPDTTVCTDDGDVCTDDYCDGAGSCAHPNNTAPCDDGLFCTAIDTCVDGACVGAEDPCEGNLLCNNVCNELADNCLVGDGEDCSDQCTVGVCAAGVCVGDNTLLSPTCRWIAIAGTGPVENRITTKKVGVRSDGQSIMDGSTCGYYTKKQQGTIEGHFVVTAGVGEGSRKGVGVKFSTAADVWGDIVTGGSTLAASKKSFVPGTELATIATGTIQARTDIDGEPALRIADTTGLHPLVEVCDADQELLSTAVPLLDALSSSVDVGKLRVKAKTIHQIATDGVSNPYVIDATSIKVGARASLWLTGTASDVVILRIAGDFNVGFNGTVYLAAGLEPENVLIYSKGRRCKTAREASGQGSIFCPFAKKLQIGFGSEWGGTFLGGIKDLRAKRNAVLTHIPFSGL